MDINSKKPQLELMDIIERSEEIKNKLLEIKNYEPIKKESILVGVLLNELKLLRNRLNEIQPILLRDVDDNKISINELKINRVRLLLTELYIEIDTEIRLSSYAERKKVKSAAENLNTEIKLLKIGNSNSEIESPKTENSNKEIKSLKTENELKNKMNEIPAPLPAKVVDGEKNKKNEKEGLGKFIKENIKLVIYSSFVLIGIVWLFVYISSLIGYSENAKIIGGFIVSVGLILYRMLRKTSLHTQSIFSLCGYIVGLLTLLYGAVLEPVISTPSAIVISLIYISYGAVEMNRLNSELFNISFVLTSTLLTFAYAYVDAPYFILFIYILVLMFVFSWLGTKKKSAILSIVMSLATTAIILPAVSFWGIETIKTDVIFSLTITLPVVILFQAMAMYSRFGKRIDLKLSDKGTMLGALYLYLMAIKPYISEFYEPFVTGRYIGLGMLVAAVIAALVWKTKNEKVLVELSYVVMLFGFIAFITTFSVDEGLGAIVKELLIVVVMLITLAVGLRKDLAALKIMSLWYVVSTSFMISDVISLIAYLVSAIYLFKALADYKPLEEQRNIINNIMHRKIEIYVPIMASILLIITSAVVKDITVDLLSGVHFPIFGKDVLKIFFLLGFMTFILMFQKLKEKQWYVPKYIALILLTVEMLDVVSDWSYITFGYLIIIELIVLVVATIMMLSKKLNANISAYSVVLLGLWAIVFTSIGKMVENQLDEDFIILSPAMLLFSAVILYVSLLKQEKQKALIPVYIVSLVGFVLTVLMTLLFISFASTEMNVGMYCFEVILFIVLLAMYVYYLFVKKEQIRLPLLQRGLDHVTNYYVRLCLTLFMILIAGFYIGYGIGIAGTQLMNSIIIATSVIYIVTEMTITEKVKPLTKNMSLIGYAIQFIYLGNLITVQLSGVSFVVKGTVFVVIGAYGLYTGIKKKSSS